MVKISLCKVFLSNLAMIVGIMGHHIILMNNLWKFAEEEFLVIERIDSIFRQFLFFFFLNFKNILFFS